MGHSHKASSFFTGPGLLVGSSHKGLSDGDSVRSPTSPLDCRMFSNIGNPHKSLRSWDCNKVGLSILDSLDDDDCDGDDGKGFGKVLQSSESPFESEPFGKIRSCSLDSCRSSSSLSRLAGQNLRASSLNFCSDNIPTLVDCPPRLLGGSSNTNNFSNTNLTCTPMSASSGNGFVSSLSASEIELSEDYTCVISHGPNPKTTHIYGGCILECHPNEFSYSGKNEGKEIGLAQAATCSKIPTSLPSKDFLSFCYFCNKKLDEGKDIYIYRGEKAFCSSSCRSEEIMIDEEMENTTNKSSEDVPHIRKQEGTFRN
ncbi:hypothetical protein OIU77_005225 [Salix suchowensis]|uniref:FLZ-type domain-containing protein n=1 Tax=Salix suchowensis TaxID=1278906 RepID=A0ABQ9ANU5_9ROSI|nr:hypothetical protein OIU77_005225 [Salix suchowensis]